MFEAIAAWLKGTINKMIGKTTIKQQFGVDIELSTPMQEAIQLWAAMYANQAPWLNSTVKSLNLPAGIAGEIARATTIEMAITIEGSPRAEYLQEEIEPVMDNIRRYTEYGAAKGGLVFKPYVIKDQIAVDIVQADQFYPVAFDSRGNLIDAIFVEQKKVGETWYTKLEHHSMTDQGCLIQNKAFKSKSEQELGVQVALEAVNDWASLLPEATITAVDRPLFAYFRYPLANNIDPSSGIGISCYSRATDLIEQADTQWSSLLWEFESGQRALYADVLAFNKDDQGNPILPMKRLYRGLNAVGNIGEGDLFKEWTPTLREQNILNGLDAMLKKIEFVCGLAYGTISDPNQVDKTATELKITQQRSYSTIKDAQKSLQNAIEQLIWAMDIYATLYSLAPKGKYETSFDFDDSVIVDRDAQFQQDLRLVQQGIMSPVEFRIRNFHETEEMAAKRIQDAKTQQPVDLFGGAD